MLTTQQSNLTPEKLRTFKGFETVSDEEAKVHIEIIKRLARILQGAFIKHKGI